MSLITVHVSFEDVIGVLPSGLSGNLMQNADCSPLVRVAMDRTHVRKREHSTRYIFDVNAKLAIGKGLVYSATRYVYINMPAL